MGSSSWLRGDSALSNRLDTLLNDPRCQYLTEPAKQSLISEV